MSFRPIAIGIVLLTLLPGTADACLFRCGRCCRPTKCQAVESAEPCKTYGQASGMQGSYNAFAGPNGAIYGVNTATGQVYEYKNGEWEPFTKSIP